jgi:hypothetical protein
VENDRINSAIGTLKFIKDLADWTSLTMPAQHKSFVFFSQGVGGVVTPTRTRCFSTPGTRGLPTRSPTWSPRRPRANTSIFAIDPRGLSLFTNGAAHFDDAPPEGHRAFRCWRKTPAAARFLRTNNLDSAFVRVVKDASSYYVLAYVLPSDRRPGSFHTISVRVNRPDVEIRSRVGYRLPSDAPTPASQPPTPSVQVVRVSQEVQAALNSPLPALGVSLSVSTVPFKGATKKTSVLLVTELTNLTLSAPDRRRAVA